MTQLSYETAIAVLFFSMLLGASMTALARFIERMFLSHDDRHWYTKALVVVSDAAVDLITNTGELGCGERTCVLSTWGAPRFYQAPHGLRRRTIRSPNTTTELNKRVRFYPTGEDNAQTGVSPT